MQKLINKLSFKKAMKTTAKQVEKNVSASFAYVKKDILMLNDSYTSIQTEISQITESYKVLAKEVEQLKNSKNKSSPKSKKKK